MIQRDVIGVLPEFARKFFRFQSHFSALFSMVNTLHAVICVLDCKQSELGTGWDSYTVILLVSPLGSLTIAKFNGVSVCCSVVALFSALYVYYFRISCPYIICMWTIYINITILRKYSGNGHACASS